MESIELNKQFVKGIWLGLVLALILLLAESTVVLTLLIAGLPLLKFVKTKKQFSAEEDETEKEESVPEKLARKKFKLIKPKKYRRTTKIRLVE
ncbi:hypothetical protein H0266_18425 [Halobacillus locisalis]|uniref:Uncharacterized protein n=1 Tax=Halobacillus locisalis TaxID=220753 RepID=A0A838CYH8_9BACI|nr:hypothetical protein [Halobacillus locisalis]MBA2176859.1 hypothetical protein [Halobacillus locisalis]